MTFRTKWQITGTIKTVTPMHIGSGDVLRDRFSTTPGASGKAVDVRVVRVDKNQRPIIPGTALKSQLHKWASRSGVLTREVVAALFGAPAPRGGQPGDTGTGGKVSFLDAAAPAQDLPYVQTAPGVRPNERAIPGWDGKRMTGIATHNAIDPVTGTVADELLFHEEFVPPGVSFSARLCADGLTDEECAALLLVLEGINDHGAARNALDTASALGDPVVFGASTRAGWGRCEWQAGTIQKLTAQKLGSWLSREPRSPWGPALELPQRDRSLLKDHVKRRLRERKRVSRGGEIQTVPSSGATASLALQIQVAERFAVLDPTRSGPGSGEDGESARLRLLRDGSGRAVLPWSSFHGVLRSTAARILRTRGVEACEHGCAPVTDIEQARRRVKVDPGREAPMCPVCRVFGTTGWASTLSGNDLVPTVASPAPTTQEFIAVCRFTGGGAKGLKFGAEGLDRPSLQGGLRIDRRRLDLIGAGEWAPALLAFALRDIAEGDVQLGNSVGPMWGRASAITCSAIDSTSVDLASLIGGAGQSDAATAFPALMAFDELCTRECGGVHA